MRQVTRFNQVIAALLIIGDVILLNLIFVGLQCTLNNYIDCHLFTHELRLNLLLLTMCYLLCTSFFGVILHERVIRSERIIKHILSTLFAHFILFAIVINFWDDRNISFSLLFIFYAVSVLALTLYRLLFRYFIKLYRKQGGNIRTAVYVGGASNMEELYTLMTSDATSGFRVLGYFDNVSSFSGFYPPELGCLGDIYDVIPYLRHHDIDHLYCCLPSKRSEEILPIVNYCENNFIRFYSVPNVRRYLKRRMCMELMGDIPILSIREEPLSQFENRLLKRLFDVIFSLLVLCTLFPFIFVLVAVITKFTSPGPIFFKQKRSGQNGKEFWCYKFRSMKVNGDSDTLQATKDDPRKTKFGNFLRKSNIDELPQFINVLIGDMSVVGPRPHMLKHTKEYSALIDKFMIRHWVKPGITGWAQVTGFRGETKRLSQMEGRVKQDIWYIENWTFLLDLLIIYKTLRNAVRGEKKAY
ncbi:undecaprenyl-phosphate glucose phosphotransferase [uncultured Bacteroides sp.]|uniref:undecaprenyl-phosphate glucose phosphotransferase n=1 Tax=uncultured Bacteroides sp. TaxID=162156 RepID=UPI002AA6C285|nr:undecaprenyl-phosphate glucose phosphotransferase [uncultured Bacteroides sp.]